MLSFFIILYFIYRESIQQEINFFCKSFRQRLSQLHIYIKKINKYIYIYIYIYIFIQVLHLSIKDLQSPGPLSFTVRGNQPAKSTQKSI